MGARIPDELRAKIAETLRNRVEGKPSYGTIAGTYDVSTSYVRKVAREEFGPGEINARAHAQAKMAHEQRKRDFASRRAALSERLLDVAEELMAEINQGSVVTGISFGEVVARRIQHTTARDKQALLTAAGIALDKARMLDQYESSADDGSDVAKILRALTGRGEA